MQNTVFIVTLLIVTQKMCQPHHTAWAIWRPLMQTTVAVAGFIGHTCTTIGKVAHYRSTSMLTLNDFPCSVSSFTTLAISVPEHVSFTFAELSSSILMQPAPDRVARNSIFIAATILGAVPRWRSPYSARQIGRAHV